MGIPELIKYEKYSKKLTENDNKRLDKMLEKLRENPEINSCTQIAEVLKYMKITWTPVEGAVSYKVRVYEKTFKTYYSSTAIYSGTATSCEYVCPLLADGRITVQPLFNDYEGDESELEYSL